MSKGRTIWQRLWQRWDARLCLLAIAAYCIAAVYGEAVYQAARLADRTPSYNQIQAGFRYVPPAFVRAFSKTPPPPGCPLYPLGSDNLGRDVGQRLIQGTRIAFHVGIITSLIAIPLGVFLACLGGYFGGRVDSAVVWLCATVASMPGLLFI